MSFFLVGKTSATFRKRVVNNRIIPMGGLHGCTDLYKESFLTVPIIIAFGIRLFFAVCQPISIVQSTMAQIQLYFTSLIAIVLVSFLYETSGCFITNCPPGGKRSLMSHLPSNRFVHKEVSFVKKN